MVPPLATRSTLAAWPDNGSAPGHTNIPPPQAAVPRQEADHGMHVCFIFIKHTSSYTSFRDNNRQSLIIHSQGCK